MNSANIRNDNVENVVSVFDLGYLGVEQDFSEQLYPGQMENKEI